MSLVKDIRDILISKGITGSLITCNVIQDKVEEICIRHTGGRGINNVSRVEDDSFQIYIRGNNYEGAYSLIEDVREALNISEYNSSTHRYMLFKEATSPIEVGKAQLTINFTTLRIKI